MLDYQGFRELFMGDAGEDSEARLLAFGDDLRADVLKVGHHGNLYASTPAFIAAVRPRFAVISVGRHNTFGHPAARAIDTLSARRRDRQTNRSLRRFQR
jgi:competence protein ComEC